MTTPELHPPRPKVTPTAQPFWDALAEHRIVIQRCGACAGWIHYPRSRCPHCGSDRLSFDEVANTGRIYAFTIARQATAPHFGDDVPQVIAIVEPDGAEARITTTVVTDDEGASLRAGTPVEAVFDDGDDGITLLRYRPAPPTD